MLRKALFWMPLAVAGFFLPSCRGGERGRGEADYEEAVPEPVVLSFALIAAGDNLFHDVLFRRSPEGDFSHFPSYYLPVRPIVQAADIAFVNQETVFAGEAAGFSSWPRFNTPSEAGLALVQTGFNVVNHANNHAMDMGGAGADYTLAFWARHPQVTVIGLYGSQEARDAPAVMSVNGISVGWLTYTYGLNGLPLPRNRPYMVPLIDPEVMEREIEALRPLVDFLIVSMHWGYEYTHSPSDEQVELAELMAGLGVDLIIGHHPHVLQPMEFLPRGGGGRTLVAYSLGNFLSAQHDNNTLLGGLLHVEARKEIRHCGEARVWIERAGIIPVVTHYELGFANFRVYPLFEYTEELAALHRNRIRADLGRANISAEYFYALARRVLGDAMINYNPFEGPEAGACAYGGGHECGEAAGMEPSDMEAAGAAEGA